MNGRAAAEKALEDEGQTKLHHIKVGFALGSIFSIPAMMAFSFIAKITIRQPNYWLVLAFAIIAACLSCIAYAFSVRERVIRDFVREWDAEMERRRMQAENDRAEAERRAARAAEQAERDRIAEAERARHRREWEREQAARQSAEELAALERKVQVLWADFQAVHNFTGEIPAEAMRERFAAELRRHFSTTDFARLAKTQNRDVYGLIGGRGQA